MTNRLHKEIDHLKKNILAQVAAVEENLRMAVTALENRDVTLANEVVEADLTIDKQEVDLEEECLKILALHQPVAADLRFIIAVLKINNDLERISDLAVNISERVFFIADWKQIDLPFDFILMGNKVQDMVRRSIDALITLDSACAYNVCRDDDEIDELNREMYKIVGEAVRRNPDDITGLLHFLGVSRYLERIADHATNIAQDIIYLIDGKIVRHNLEEHERY